MRPANAPSYRKESSEVNRELKQPPDKSAGRPPRPAEGGQLSIGDSPAGVTRNASSDLQTATSSQRLCGVSAGSAEARSRTLGKQPAAHM